MLATVRERPPKQPWPFMLTHVMRQTSNVRRLSAEKRPAMSCDIVTAG